MPISNYTCLTCPVIRSRKDHHLSDESHAAGDCQARSLLVTEWTTGHSTWLAWMPDNQASAAKLLESSATRFNLLFVTRVKFTLYAKYMPVTNDGINIVIPARIIWLYWLSNAASFHSQNNFPPARYTFEGWTKMTVQEGQRENQRVLSLLLTSFRSGPYLGPTV